MAIKTNVNHSIGTLTLSFPEHGELVFHAERVSEELRQYAMMDRFEAKIVDCMAIERKKFPNMVIPESVKFERAGKMVAYLESGTTEWNPGRSSADSGLGKRMLIARAFEAIGLAKSDEVIKALTAAQMTKLMLDARLKPEIDKILAAQVVNVDVDGLFEPLLDDAA